MNAIRLSARPSLSASTLKILACLFMLIDHVGLKFFGDEEIFRIIGRLAFPIFSFFIAEGCRYTRNKTKRFLLLFLLGVCFETAYFLYTKKLQGNIFLTFSASVLLIYCLQTVKRSFASGSLRKKLLSLLLFTVSLALAFPLSILLDLDYGFFGVILPLFVTIFDYKQGETPECFRRLDTLPFKLCSFFLGLLLLVFANVFGSLQVWCLLTPLLLIFYSGKVGVRRFKYAFYIFYPAHLLLLEGIAMLMR